MKNLYRVIVNSPAHVEMTEFFYRISNLTEYVELTCAKYNLEMISPDQLWLSPEELTVITLQLPTEFSIIRA